MKNQALFSLKDKSKNLKCHLLQFLFDALRIKIQRYNPLSISIILIYQNTSCMKEDSSDKSLLLFTFQLLLSQTTDVSK